MPESKLYLTILCVLAQGRTTAPHDCGVAPPRDGEDHSREAFSIYLSKLEDEYEIAPDAAAGCHGFRGNPSI